jgi:hypothetical protein
MEATQPAGNPVVTMGHLAAERAAGPSFDTSSILAQRAANLTISG